MPELEGAYSAYLPVTTRLACEAVLNVGDYPLWWARAVTTKLERGVNGKAAVGSVIQVRLDRTTFEYRVRRIEAGKKIDLTCAGSYHGPATWTFQPENGGTRVTFQVALDPRGLLSRVFSRGGDGLAEAHARAVTTSLERLAAHLAG